MAFQEVRGRMNDQVVTRTRQGLVTKHRPKYKYPKVAAVQAGNERLKQAASVWVDLTYEEVLAWRAYAATVFRVEPVTLERYAQGTHTTFLGLAVKVLQVGEGPIYGDAGAPASRPTGVESIPRMPPTSDFLGDNLSVSVEAIATGLRFTSTAPNSAGVVTELMIQKLPNHRRQPTKFYKSAGFAVFGGPIDVPLEPGFYACGYRFVRSATGQMTEMRSLGMVEVTG